MIYELAPGVLIQTPSDDPSGGKHVLDEEQIDDARERLEKGQEPRAIARRLGAELFEPPPEPDAEAPQLAVDLAGLVAVVGAEEAARLAGIPQDVLERLAEAADPAGQTDR